MNESNLVKVVYQSAEYRVLEIDNLRILQLVEDPSTDLSRMYFDNPHYLVPYARSMLMPLAFIDTPRNAILVGLGGGTMASFIHRWLPEIRLVALELIPEVVDLARTYFDLPHDDEGLQVVTGDGVKYMLAHPVAGQVDLILSDASGAQHCAVDAVHTPEFYEACYRALRPGGVMTVNIDRPTVEWVASYTQMLPKIFADIHFDMVSPHQGVVTLWKERKGTQLDDVLQRAARFDAAVEVNSADAGDSVKFVDLAKTMADRFVGRQ